MKAISSKINYLDVKEFLESKYYNIVCVFFTFVFYAFGFNYVAAIFLFSIICLDLILIDDFMKPLLPFLLFTAIVLRKYASFDYWVKLWPAGIFIIASLITHFVRFPHKLNCSKMIFPTSAVAIAVTFGGLFSISAEEYFQLTALYYVFGLGIGLVILYVLFRTYIDFKADYVLNLTKTMVFYGMFLVLILALFYVENFELLITDFSSFNNKLQMGNNLSANLFYTIPFAFYYMRREEKPIRALLLGALEVIALFGTLSRGGIIMGLVMSPLYMIYIYKTNDKNLKIIMSILLTIMLMGIVVLIAVKFDKIVSMLKVRSGEARFGLFNYAIECFKESPIFGKGLGAYGEYYYPKKGAMYWYHSTPFQVIGSLGSVGIIAYVYQFLFRVNLFRKRHYKFTSALMLSFIGFELLALVNPGDFCPLPYQLFMILMFTVFEKECEKEEELEKVFI